MTSGWHMAEARFFLELLSPPFWLRLQPMRKPSLKPRSMKPASRVSGKIESHLAHSVMLTGVKIVDHSLGSAKVPGSGCSLSSRSRFSVNLHVALCLQVAGCPYGGGEQTWLAGWNTCVVIKVRLGLWLVLLVQDYRAQL